MNEEMNEEQEYGMENLREDLDFLRKMNLIEVVGINEEGEWLYSLTKEAKQKVDASGSDDIWCVLHELITESEIMNTDEN